MVKTTGDGLLVEFGSVIEALSCAAEVQAALAESNCPLSPDRRIEFRIVIHMGDVVTKDGDIVGDGVNVIARLEGLAEPGGICVSARPGRRHRQARSRLRGHRRAGTQFHLRGGRLNAARRAPVEADQGLGYGGRQRLGRTP